MRIPSSLHEISSIPQASASMNAQVSDDGSERNVQATEVLIGFEVGNRYQYVTVNRKLLSGKIGKLQ